MEQGAEWNEVRDVAKLHLQAAQTGLNTAVRVDEARLKKRQQDSLPRLLEIIMQEEKKLALVIEQS